MNTKLNELKSALKSAQYQINEARKNWDALTNDEQTHFLIQEQEAERRYVLYTGDTWLIQLA